MHWPLDVLYGLLTEVVEPVRQLVPNLVVHDLRNADSVRLGQAFQPGRDIDAIAEDVVRLDDHVAQIDTDAKPDALVLRHVGIAAGHAALYFDSAQHRFDDARKLDEHAVAG